MGKHDKIKFTRLDAAAVLTVAALGAWIVFRVQTRLDYQWNWAVIPQYLFRFDQAAGKWVPNLLMQGLFTTIRLSVWSCILATAVGAAVGLMRLSSSLFWRMLARTYVEAIRNLPPLVLVFIFYFFVADQIMPLLALDSLARQASPGVQGAVSWLLAPPAYLSAFASAVVTLALYEGAYIAEIVRAGVQSVERGQWEAAHALGLSSWDRMRHVIGPQALRNVVPPLAGQFISAIKDSAIVSVISIGELTFQGMELMAVTYLTFEVWTTVLVMYLVLTLMCSRAAHWIEVRMQRPYE